jgi:segregation and condensation protein B
MEVDAGYQLRTNPENSRWVKRLEAIKPVRMSRAALEVLAVVAYRQPVTRVEVDNIRGVDSGAVLRQLLARDLVRIVGRKEEPGRPFLYGTTHEFLNFFSLNKLDDLPPLRDVTELAEEQRAASQPDDVTPPEDGPDEDLEVTPEEIAEEDADLLREDTGDDEVAAALEEARAAAKGADSIRSKIRKMARSQREEGVGHEEARRALQSLEDLVQRRRHKEPSPEEQATEGPGAEGQPAPPAAPSPPAPEEPSSGDPQ